MPYSRNKQIKPIISDPIDVIELQFEAGPDAPKNKQYTPAQIFEAKQKRVEKMAKAKQDRRNKVK